MLKNNSSPFHTHFKKYHEKASSIGRDVSHEIFQSKFFLNKRCFLFLFIYIHVWNSVRRRSLSSLCRQPTLFPTNSCWESNQISFSVFFMLQLMNPSIYRNMTRHQKRKGTKFIFQGGRGGGRGAALTILPRHST